MVCGSHAHENVRVVGCGKLFQWGFAPHYKMKLPEEKKVEMVLPSQVSLLLIESAL